jgi:hypothetical protein
MELDVDSSKPLYSINVAADLIGVSPRTLREYEKAGFVKPVRVNGNRRYSNNDIQFIKNITFYLNEVGMTMTGLKLLYMMTPCWKIKNCGIEECPGYGNYHKKCWEAVKGHDNCNWRTCQGCPIYLVHEKNRGMKIQQDRDIGPKCFIRSQDKKG